MNVIKFGFGYWKRNVGWSLFAKLLSAIALTADLLLPMLTALFINYIIQDNPAEEEKGIFAFLVSGKYGEVHTMQLFWHLAGIFTVLLAIKLCLVYTRNIINQKMGLRLETDLRMATFHKLMKLDSETLSAYNTGELLTTINSDTIMFKEMFCRIIPNIFDSIFVLVVTIGILASINAWLLLIPVIATPFFVVSLLRFRKLARANYQNIRACNSEMSLTVQENIEAVRLVRSFTNEQVEKEKFDKANGRLKESHIRQIRLSSTFDAIFSAIKQSTYIGTIAVSAVLVMKGYMMVGYLVACANYVLKIMDYISLINNMMFQMQQQLVSGQKMMNYMNCESRIPDGTMPVREPEQVALKVSHASMIMDGKQVLKDINLDIPFGKKLGVVGGTGSGKSVLLESFIRVHDMTSGEITINGEDIRNCELDSLRNKFSYVFQDVFLFSNTIDSNIAYAQPDIEKNQVIEAARHAQAHGFIQKLLDGYETIVGERGLGISGGQKQRVSIARALLKDAPVLILDDSTSALDRETEKELLKDIKENYPEKTLLISAHRLSSVVDCDEIIYLQDGMIVERGNFKELMELDGHFAAVYRIQEAQQKAVVDFDALAGKEA
ncbi:MAG: ABC transporter ATP-binding protein [Lachnospiraceae bacterium]|nr:ABC transporter ATP-binding protein [Lachnospiraceae bacterium]